MNDRVPIAILASGRGSNFESIAQAIGSGKLQARITHLISDFEEAPVVEAAKRMGVKAKVVKYEKSREFHDQKIVEAMSDDPPRFLVLAGYMRLLSPGLLKSFSSDQGYTRIVNIHPSLLPAFPGLHSYKKAFEYGCKTTGVTVHLVGEGLDDGPICAQESFSIVDCQSAAEVEQKGLKTEHLLYPQTLSWVLPEKFQIQSREGGRSCVCKS